MAAEGGRTWAARRALPTPVFLLLPPQKLQLALAPFLKLDTPGLEGVSPDPISLLAHSLQQLDRIESLSEQISFLEERLETCE